MFMSIVWGSIKFLEGQKGCATEYKFDLILTVHRR